MILRDYQREAVDQVICNLDDRPVLTLPTGAGKTVCAVKLVEELGLRCLWLAHRRELIAQAVERLRAFSLRTGVIMAGCPVDPKAQIQVASVQTAVRRHLPAVDMIVCDEAHHAAATTYRKIFAQYPGVPIVGLTATPFRLDGKGLGDLFGSIIVGCWTDQLVADGTLVEPVVFAPDTPSMQGVRIRCGEFSESGMAAVMNRPKIVGSIIDTWLRLGGDRRTVCFAVNIEHSKKIVEAFRERGVLAEHLDGTTARGTRDAILARLASGLTRIVSNCAVLTEGWDLPELEVAILARPTASLAMHLQTVGRIMRAAPDKTGALVLDHAGNHLRHGLVTERFEYSLEDRVKAKRSTPEGEPRMRRCPQCFLIVSPGAQECPGCGHVFKAEAPDIHAPGELVRFSGSQKPSPEDQQRVWERLEQQRVHWGRTPNWSLFQFKSRFGFWPLVVDGRLVQPERATWAEKRTEYMRLVAAGLRKGVPDPHKWASAVFKGTFGGWPPWSWRNAS